MSKPTVPRRTVLAQATVSLAAASVAPLLTRPSVASAADDLRSVTDANQWWSWRGPRGDNSASPNATAPLRPDPSKVRWAVPIPGRAHGSLLVTKDTVYWTGADTAAGTQFIGGVDRETSKPKFQTVVHRGGLPRENHPKNTEASTTPAFDGENLYVTFYNRDSIQLSALTTAGQLKWQKQIAPYRPQQYKYGYAASPVLYGNLILIAAETDTGSALVGYERASGREVWRTPRPASTTFSSPIVGRVAGRDQLLISGAEMVASYDPATGRPLWQTPATTMATCGTMVWNDTHVFASGGYPKAETVCVRGDGSGEVVWSSRQKCYEQSMLLVGDYLYGITDAGVCHCWRAADGRVMWRERFGGKWSSSPLLVGQQIHAFNEGGQGWTFDANPERYVGRSTSKVGDEVFSTPCVVDDTMYLRVANLAGGRRQERLLAMV